MLLENVDRAVGVITQVALEGRMLELVLLEATPLREGSIALEALVLACSCFSACVVGKAGDAGEATRAFVAREVGGSRQLVAMLA